ncbi:MAG TPA: FeoB-associated Cys-rich membrane protein [Candidatus Aveggerthella excrementigallinarum]|nr:FeoB-associated Cys-rich membrane protein [Candidatus Aveggerthella excrementigallinarum]
MIVPLEVTPSTVVVGLLIVAAMAWAVRRITHRGLCDCKDHCGSKTCSHCSAVDRMVEDMEKAAKATKPAK